MAATHLPIQLRVRPSRANKTKVISGVTPYGSNFNNVVDYYIERGCQSDLPKYLKDKVIFTSSSSFFREMFYF